MVEYPKSGSIIYIDFDPSGGAEIRKRRPAVVVSNNILAQISPSIEPLFSLHLKYIRLILFTFMQEEKTSRSNFTRKIRQDLIN